MPSHVLTVLDQAYFEYLDEPDYPEGVAEYLAAGHRVLVLRTFSKIFGLAGQRVGYGVGPADVITAIGKVRRAFDVTSAGQEAALASLDDTAEIARRRAVNKESMALLVDVLREHRFEPAGPAVANFLFVRVGDADALNDALLRRGVIVRPMRSFGAPDALRITRRHARRGRIPGRGARRARSSRRRREVRFTLRLRWRFVGIRAAKREPRPDPRLSSAGGRPSRRSSS